jgi:Na+-driven multidrug efflux pump
VRALADEPQTIAYGTFAMWLLPLVAFVSMPFPFCRPLFEGMQQARPPMLMALLRYVVLAPPLGLLGMHLAESWGHSRFHGLMVGLLLATALCSGIFLAWGWRFLRSMAPPERSAPGSLAGGYVRS